MENYIVLSPQFCVNDFADSSIMLKILEKHYLVKTSRESSQKIKIAFDDEGIEIPFPQIVMHRPKAVEERIKMIQTKLKNSNRIP
jgi:small conductance mechanosensitive channel